MAVILLLAAVLLIVRELSAIRHARQAGARTAQAIMAGEREGRAERAERAREDGLWKEGT